MIALQITFNYEVLYEYRGTRQLLWNFKSFSPKILAFIFLKHLWKHNMFATIHYSKTAYIPSMLNTTMLLKYYNINTIKLNAILHKL